MTPAAIAAFLLLASDLPTKPTAEPQSAKELYNAWRWYGLPLPPKGARLVLWGHTVADTKLALMTRDLSPTRPALLVYQGIEQPEYRPSRLKLRRPTPQYLDQLDLHPAETLLTYSVQGWHLGRPDIAEAALRLGRQSDLRGYGDAPRGPKHILHSVQRMAWQHAHWDLTNPGTDRHALLDRLVRLTRDRPAEFATGEAFEQVRRLELTLTPSTAEKGSVLADVEGLTDEPFEQYDPSRPLFEGMPCQARLVERGFEVITTLIAHTADVRLCRETDNRLSSSNHLARVATLGTSCRTLLVGLSADGIEVQHGRDSTTFQEQAWDWFHRARVIGEEAWALEHVLPDWDESFAVNIYLLRLLSAKYPHRLPLLYRTLLAEMPEADSGIVAAELARSALPTATKLAVLREALGNPLFRHRLAAAQAIESIDPTEFRAELCRLIDWLATAPWTEQVGCTNALLPVLSRVDAPACWKAFGRYIRAAPIRERMQTIDSLFYQYETREPERMRAPLKLLESGLSDETIWREDDIAEAIAIGPHCEYPKLAVQNFAAVKLAEFFDIDVPWKPDRSAAEWAAVRADVRAALAKYTADHR